MYPFGEIWQAVADFVRGSSHSLSDIIPRLLAAVALARQAIDGFLVEQGVSVGGLTLFWTAATGLVMWRLFKVLGRLVVVAVIAVVGLAVFQHG